MYYMILFSVCCLVFTFIGIFWWRVDNLFKESRKDSICDKCKYMKIEKSIDMSTGLTGYRCVCSTKPYKTEQEAIDAWNRRVR